MSCKPNQKAKNGIAQKKNTCWFNAPLNAFIIGRYGKFLLRFKVIEYLKKMTLNEVYNFIMTANRSFRNMSDERN